MTRLALTCLLSRGPPAPRGLPGHRQDPLARALAASVQGPNSRDPVHPRPAAERRHRRDDLRPEHQEVRVPPGPDLRDHRPRRRDQPRLAEDPVGPARGHGGGPGHRRRRPHSVGEPFMVIATQNPIEQAGHLPAARGAARPVPHEDQRRLPRPRGDHADPHATPRSATAPPPPAGRHRRRHRRHGRARRRGLRRPGAALDYVTRIAEASRRHPSLKLGLSVRGCLAYVRCAKTWAASQGRTYVVPDDIKMLAVPVLSHRLLLDAEAQFSGTTVIQVIEQILGDVPPPVQGSGQAPGSAPGAGTPAAAGMPATAGSAGSRSGPTRRSCSGRRRATTRRPSAPCTGPRTPPGSTPHASTRIPRAPVRPRVADRSS